MHPTSGAADRVSLDTPAAAEREWRSDSGDTHESCPRRTLIQKRLDITSFKTFEIYGVCTLRTKRVGSQHVHNESGGHIVCDPDPSIVPLKARYWLPVQREAA